MKNFLSGHWFKIAIFLLLTFVVIILGSYLNEKNSLAREQFLQKTISEQQEGLASKEKEERDFDAKQKSACLEIYKQESDKWNNSNGWRYDDAENLCYIQYKESKPSTDEECTTKYTGADGKIYPNLVMDYLLCKDGMFEKTF